MTSGGPRPNSGPPPKSDTVAAQKTTPPNPEPAPIKPTRKRKKPAYRKPQRSKPLIPRTRRAILKNGRPLKYRPEFAEQAFGFALLGATNEEMALGFNVNLNSIYYWRATHADFADALSRGRLIADARVAQGLYKAAKGHSKEAVKIYLPKDAKTAEEAVLVPYQRYYPPDPGAAMNWLSNRQRDKWRQRVDVAHEDARIPLDHEARIRWARDLVARARAVLNAPAPPMIDMDPISSDTGEDE